MRLHRPRHRAGRPVPPARPWERGTPSTPEKMKRPRRVGHKGRPERFDQMPICARTPSASLTVMSPIPQIAPCRRLQGPSFQGLRLFLLLAVLTPSQTDHGEALEQTESTFFQMIFPSQFTAPCPELIPS